MVWPIGGKRYRTVVVDPPWPMRMVESHERPRQAGGLPYPVMSIEDIRALPVGELAGDAAHLYLWVPNKHLPVAFELVEAWGFTFSTLLTWKKKIGATPFWWRQISEHVLFAVRGGLHLDEVGIDTVFEGRSNRHSEKPDEFFALVERASPGPRLEMSARRARAGWDAHGLEVGSSCTLE